MKFFILAHNVLAFKCLKGLYENNIFPDFVIIHKNFEREKLIDNFFIPITDICKKYGIKLYSSEKISEHKSQIAEEDFGICLGFMEILKPEIFEIPKLGIYNLHCGKLPEYRGRAPISRSLINGEKYLNITIHKIDSGVDSGDIIYEHPMLINDDDDAVTLYNKCCDLSPEAVSRTIKLIVSKNFELKKQNIQNKPNKVLSDDERKIKWDKCGKDIHNLIRALPYPYPNPFTYHKGNKYYFEKSEIYGKMISEKAVGEIVEISDSYIIVNTKDLSLKIHKIKNSEFKLINHTKFFNKGDKFENN
jgi:methionyl-tRNA formyltransferase